MPTKKKKSTKVIAGKGGLRTKLKLDWKIITIIVLLVASAGTYFVYRSRAHAYAQAWVPGRDSNVTASGGSFVRKSNGVTYYKSVNAGDSVVASITGTVNGATYCADGTSNFQAGVTGIYDSWSSAISTVPGTPTSTKTTNGNNFTVCYTMHGAASNPSWVWRMRVTQVSAANIANLTVWRFYQQDLPTRDADPSCYAGFIGNTIGWHSYHLPAGSTYLASLTRAGSNNPPTLGLDPGATDSGASRGVVPPLHTTSTYTVGIYNAATGAPVTSCSASITIP